jgi:hypothetical protein
MYCMSYHQDDCTNFEVTFDKFVIVRSNEFFTEMKQNDSSIIVLYTQYEDSVQ